MNTTIAEDVYNTLTDALLPPYQVPGVENAFAEGSLCDRLYAEIYQANQRLCARLGQPESDPDVELIINNFLEINKHLCLRSKLFQFNRAINDCLAFHRTHTCRGGALPLPPKMQYIFRRKIPDHCLAAM